VAFLASENRVSNKALFVEVGAVCTYCDEIEDEIHLFIECNHVQRVRSWFKGMLSLLYPSIDIQNLDRSVLLFGYYPCISPHKIGPWKLLHAETLRAIWFARGQSIFESRIVSFNESIALIKCRVLHSVEAYYYNLGNACSAKNKRRTIKRFLHLWTQKVPLCTLNGKGYLASSVEYGNIEGYNVHAYSHVDSISYTIPA
jgi:hypothetical protein